MHYTPTSRFPQQFLHSASAIVEFSLLGSRHAVPQEEVRDDYPLLPILPVPGTAEIVLGVAALQGELLPVLDLAALFGRRTPLSPQSRMLHLVNGDFQALLVTEEVTARQPLPLEVQRKIPIALPYQVLYGCYLAADMVRLILNVESLAVHFEKMAVRELVASLAPELLAAPAVASASSPPDATSTEVEPAGVVDPAETGDDAAASPAPSPASATIPEADAVVAPVTEAETDSAVAAVSAVADEAQTAEAAVIKERQRQAEEEATRESQRQAAKEARLQAEAEAREQERTLAAELAREAAEKQRREAERQAAEAEIRAQAAALAAVQDAEATRELQRQVEEKAARERQQQAEAAARLQAEAAAREEERAAAAERMREEAEKLRREAERQARAEAESRAQAATQQVPEVPEVPEVPWYEQKTAVARADDADILAAFASTLIPEEFPATATSPPPDATPYRRPKSRRYGKQIGLAVAIVLLLAFGLTFINQPPTTQQPLPAPVPPPPQASAQPAPSLPAPLAQTTAPAPPLPPPPTPAPRVLPAEPEAPLYLAVPASKDVPEAFIYTVVAGDNLWNIAKRFTGDPFNYPRVARDNSIATPDLIFPGQKIRLQPPTGAAELH